MAEVQKKLTRQLTLKMQDLWQQLSSLPLPEEEKLDACFEKIPVLLFPRTNRGQVIEMSSETSIAEAVRILFENKIWSAPVRDATAPEDASWIDRYLGIVEFASIVMWILHQSEVAAFGRSVGLAGTEALASVGDIGATYTNGLDAVSEVDGEFFETLTSSDLYMKTKVKDIVGSFRWAPFLPIQNSDNLLTLLLILSKYRVKSLPVVESGEGRIENFITQSAVLHMLSQCTGLPWFETLGKRLISDLGLPRMKPSQVLKVCENQPVLEAFKLMKKKGVGGVPVIGKEGNNPVGNISMRDVQYLLIAPEIFKNYRSLRAKDFLEATRGYLKETDSTSPLLHPLVTCRSSDSVQDVLLKLDKHNVRRAYVVDDEDGPVIGVVTLRDLISVFVVEPPNYFGEFFTGWTPSCEKNV